MATAYDIVLRAYRKLGIVAEDEPMTADQAANGIDALNMMMHGWELHGVNVLHADLALTDTFPLQAKFQETTVYLLASKLAPDNSLPAPDTDRFMRALQSAYLIIDEARLPNALVFNPSRRRAWLP